MNKLLILLCFAGFQDTSLGSPVIGELHQGLEIIAVEGNKFYLINPDYKSPGVNFNDAVKYCDSNGYTMASITKLSERNALIRFYEREGTNYSGHFWLGLSDSEQEGRWLWLDTGLQVGPYLGWAFPQPDGGRAQNCAFFGQDSLAWWDDVCENRHKALCQWNLV